jgi:hypothetical protein
VKKVWRQAEREAAGRPARASIAGQALVIGAWLETDQAKPRKQRHTVQRIHERLRDEQGSGGNNSTVGR